MIEFPLTSKILSVSRNILTDRKETKRFWESGSKLRSTLLDLQGLLTQFFDYLYQQIWLLFLNLSHVPPILTTSRKKVLDTNGPYISTRKMTKIRNTGLSVGFEFCLLLSSVVCSSLHHMEVFLIKFLKSFYEVLGTGLFWPL